jgi:hypothetical protein
VFATTIYHAVYLPEAENLSSVICHLSFVICGAASLQWQMKNDRWKMEIESVVTTRKIAHRLRKTKSLQADGGVCRACGKPYAMLKNALRLSSNSCNARLLM